MAKEIIIERRPSTGITNITQAQKNIVLDPSMSDVARESTSQQILTAVGNIDFTTLAKQGDNPTATNSAILKALSRINPQDPNSKALAEFFGVTLLQGYEFMTDTEVTDELEDIMQALDPDLTAEKAASITAEAMQIIVRA